MNHNPIFQPPADVEKHPKPAPPQAISAIPVTANTSYELMSVGDLLALPEADFHPPLNEKRIAVMAAEFDPDLMEPPSIAAHHGCDSDGKDIDGTYVIYEGRHRLHAARIAEGDGWITLVRVTRGGRKAPELFARLNGSRRKFGAVENYNARLNAGEKKQALVAEIAARHGFTVGGTRVTARGRRVMGGSGIWHINAITALYDALGWGEEILDDTLALIAEVTRRRENRGEPDRLNTWTSAKIIQSVAYLLNMYSSEVDPAILADVLEEIPPHVAAPVNANSAGQNTVSMVRLYNRRFTGRGAARKQLRESKIQLRNR